MVVKDAPQKRKKSGFEHEAHGPRHAKEGIVKRAVWFEALPEEWQAIIDEDTDTGRNTAPGT